MAPKDPIPSGSDDAPVVRDKGWSPKAIRKELVAVILAAVALLIVGVLAFGRGSPPPQPGATMIDPARPG